MAYNVLESADLDRIEKALFIYRDALEEVKENLPTPSVKDFCAECEEKIIFLEASLGQIRDGNLTLSTFLCDFLKDRIAEYNNDFYMFCSSGFNVCGPATKEMLDFFVDKKILLDFTENSHIRPLSRLEVVEENLILSVFETMVKSETVFSNELIKVLSYSVSLHPLLRYERLPNVQLGCQSGQKMLKDFYMVFEKYLSFAERDLKSNDDINKLLKKYVTDLSDDVNVSVRLKYFLSHYMLNHCGFIVQGERNQRDFQKILCEDVRVNWILDQKSIRNFSKLLEDLQQVFEDYYCKSDVFHYWTCLAKKKYSKTNTIYFKSISSNPLDFIPEQLLSEKKLKAFRGRGLVSSAYCELKEAHFFSTHFQFSPASSDTEGVLQDLDVQETLGVLDRFVPEEVEEEGAEQVNAMQALSPSKETIIEYKKRIIPVLPYQGPVPKVNQKTLKELHLLVEEKTKWTFKRFKNLWERLGGKIVNNSGGSHYVLLGPNNEKICGIFRPHGNGGEQYSPRILRYLQASCYYLGVLG